MRCSPTIDQLVLVSAGKLFDECGGSMNCRSWAVSFSVEAAPRDCPNPTQYLTNRGWVGWGRHSWHDKSQNDDFPENEIALIADRT